MEVDGKSTDIKDIDDIFGDESEKMNSDNVNEVPFTTPDSSYPSERFYEVEPEDKPNGTDLSHVSIDTKTMELNALCEGTNEVKSNLECTLNDEIDNSATNTVETSNSLSFLDVQHSKSDDECNELTRSKSMSTSFLDIPGGSISSTLSASDSMSFLDIDSSIAEPDLATHASDLKMTNTTSTLKDLAIDQDTLVLDNFNSSFSIGHEGDLTFDQTLDQSVTGISTEVTSEETFQHSDTKIATPFTVEERYDDLVASKLVQEAATDRLPSSKFDVLFETVDDVHQVDDVNTSLESTSAEYNQVKCNTFTSTPNNVDRARGEVLIDTTTESFDIPNTEGLHVDGNPLLSGSNVFSIEHETLDHTASDNVYDVPVGSEALEVASITEEVLTRDHSIEPDIGSNAIKYLQPSIAQIDRSKVDEHDVVTDHSHQHEESESTFNIINCIPTTSLSSVNNGFENGNIINEDQQMDSTAYLGHDVMFQESECLYMEMASSPIAATKEFNQTDGTATEAKAAIGVLLNDEEIQASQEVDKLSLESNQVSGVMDIQEEASTSAEIESIQEDHWIGGVHNAVRVATETSETCDTKPVIEMATSVDFDAKQDVTPVDRCTFTVEPNVVVATSLDLHASEDAEHVDEPLLGAEPTIVVTTSVDLDTSEHARPVDEHLFDAEPSFAAEPTIVVTTSIDLDTSENDRPVNEPLFDAEPSFAAEPTIVVTTSVDLDTSEDVRPIDEPSFDAEPTFAAEPSFAAEPTIVVTTSIDLDSSENTRPVNEPLFDAEPTVAAEPTIVVTTSIDLDTSENDRPVDEPLFDAEPSLAVEPTIGVPNSVDFHASDCAIRGHEPSIDINVVSVSRDINSTCSGEIVTSNGDHDIEESGEYVEHRSGSSDEWGNVEFLSPHGTSIEKSRGSGQIEVQFDQSNVDESSLSFNEEISHDFFEGNCATASNGDNPSSNELIQKSAIVQNENEISSRDWVDISGENILENPESSNPWLASPPKATNSVKPDASYNPWEMFQSAPTESSYNPFEQMAEEELRSGNVHSWQQYQTAPVSNEKHPLNSANPWEAILSPKFPASDDFGNFVAIKKESPKSSLESPWANPAQATIIHQVASEAASSWLATGAQNVAKSPIGWKTSVSFSDFNDTNKDEFGDFNETSADFQDFSVGDTVSRGSFSDFKDEDQPRESFSDFHAPNSSDFEDFGDFSSGDVATLTATPEFTASFSEPSDSNEFGDFETAAESSFGDFTTVAAPSMMSAIDEDAIEKLLYEAFPVPPYVEKATKEQSPNETCWKELNDFENSQKSVVCPNLLSNLVHEVHAKHVRNTPMNKRDEQETFEFKQCVNALSLKLQEAVVHHGLISKKSDAYAAYQSMIASNDKSTVLAGMKKLQFAIFEDMSTKATLAIAEQAALSAQASIASHVQSKENSKVPGLKFQFTWNKDTQDDKPASLRVLTPTGASISKLNRNSFSNLHATSNSGGGSEGEHTSGSDGDGDAWETTSVNSDGGVDDHSQQSRTGSGSLTGTSGTSGGLMKKFTSKLGFSSLRSTLSMSSSKNKIVSLTLRRKGDAATRTFDFPMDTINGGFDELKWKCAVFLYDAEEVASVAPSQIQVIASNGSILSSKSDRSALQKLLKEKDSVWTIDIGDFRESTVES